MALPPRYRIHPAIGVARVGDAPADEFFLGPERPHAPTRGVPGVGRSVPPFKTGGRIKRQATPFRTFEYTEKSGVYTMSREITLAEPDDPAQVDRPSRQPVALVLHVRRARRLAAAAAAAAPDAAHARVNDRRSLEIDPRPRSIEGKSAIRVEFRKGTAANPSAERWPTLVGPGWSTSASRAPTRSAGVT